MSEKIVTIAGEQKELAFERSGTTVRAGDRSLEIVAAREDELEIRVDGRLHIVPFVIGGSTISFAFDGEIWFAEVADKGARAKRPHRELSTSAPMPGVVLKILVAPGDVVAKGAPLIVLEAMKMEHQIIAPRDGTVEAIHCREGELVQSGIELVTVREQA